MEMINLLDKLVIFEEKGKEEISFKYCENFVDLNKFFTNS